MLTEQKNTETKTVLLSDLETSFVSFLMQDIFHKVLQIAKLESNVVIVGEIGSGKKIIAETIHKNSNRLSKPFVSFYCVDINETDYKDAFWGQLNFEENQLTLRYDALEKAESGVLYLDQFSELSPKYMDQIIDSIHKGFHQLYRNNQNNKLKPRIILSFNQESYRDIINTDVWKVLLDKLDPMVIMLPPLRERKEDIPVLIDHFLEEIKKANADFKDLGISSQALSNCFNYSWPGNIRQLKNAILQGAILSFGQTIKSEHLPFTINWNLPYKIDDPKGIKG
ncbi:sigma 54-interacting transcriptional regulator [Fodinibius sp. Rm-B-1B1-1]|uniref:sigma 54-interacting transcriptional regulator n=1 Tax=Fodinibius alkaliphilus TaxID=3140241 RepID=UPI003159A48F